MASGSIIRRQSCLSSPSRVQEHIRLLYLNEYKRYLQDEYSGHGALYERGDSIEVGCWAHCRRRFFEFAKDQKEPGLAAQALQWIAKLYVIESRVKDQAPDIKPAALKTDALPVLAQFLQWIEANSIGLLPRAPLAKAFGYALRHWEALIRYTESYCQTTML